jgi:hypothetical protein
MRYGSAVDLVLPRRFLFRLPMQYPVGAGIDQPDFRPFLVAGFRWRTGSARSILWPGNSSAPLTSAPGLQKLRDDFEISLHLLSNKRTRIRMTLAKLTAQLLVYCVAQLHNFTPVQASRSI